MTNLEAILEVRVRRLLGTHKELEADLMRRAIPRSTIPDEHDTLPATYRAHFKLDLLDTTAPLGVRSCRSV